MEGVAAAPNRLELVESGRPRPGSPGLTARARYDERLAEPLGQLHFEVDGVSVLQRVLALDLPMPYGFAAFEFVSVADLAWPAEAASSLRQPAGRADRDPAWDVLEPGGCRCTSVPSAPTCTAVLSRSLSAERPILRPDVRW